MSKSKDAQALLDELDSLSAGAGPATAAATTSRTSVDTARPKGTDSATEALEFLEGVAKDVPSRSKMVTPIPSRPLSRATERVSLSSLKAKAAEQQPSTSPAPLGSSPLKAAPVNANTTPAAKEQTSGASSGWGWNSVWSTASAAVQQAKNVVDEQVKNLPANLPTAQQTEQWREGLKGYVRSAQLEKLGQDLKTVSLSTLTDILHAVAPPIAAHEVIQVWLSHDLQGYDGVETLVYRAFSRILEQVEGGDLVVNRGNESRPKDGVAPVKRELNSAEGFDEALKLSKANIDSLMSPASKASTSPTSPTTADNPTTYSTVYLRIQPYLADSPFSSESASKSRQLLFLLHLHDPSHTMEASTTTQPLPTAWMDLWDENESDYEWVEDHMAEILRLGVEILAQEYVVMRMGWKAGEASPVENSKDKEKAGVMSASEEEGDEAFEKVEKASSSS